MQIEYFLCYLKGRVGQGEERQSSLKCSHRLVLTLDKYRL